MLAQQPLLHCRRFLVPVAAHDLDVELRPKRVDRLGPRRGPGDSERCADLLTGAVHDPLDAVMAVSHRLTPYTGSRGRS